MNRVVNWQQFGLKKNPYDTLPLIEGGDIPIDQAFVGRVKEKALIDRLIESDNRLCLAICGDVGVGKTSLINFEKFLWKYTKSDKKYLFSFRREIEANVSFLNKKGFLLEIIGSILRELRLLEPKLFERELLWDRIKNTAGLSPEKLRVLTYLVETKKYISQVEASKILKKQESNISSYYFKPLKIAGIIEEKESRGKYKYWGLTQQYLPLTYLLDAQKKLTKILKSEIEKGQGTLW